MLPIVETKVGIYGSLYYSIYLKFFVVSFWKRTSTSPSLSLPKSYVSLWDPHQPPSKCSDHQIGLSPPPTPPTHCCQHPLSKLLK